MARTKRPHFIDKEISSYKTRGY